jgi:hypothetical protein
MADKGLLLGINEYAYVSDLRGCENDVRDVSKLLIETFGFSDRNIRRHVNDAVTKSAVRDGFAWLVDGARAGDRLVFHFSGHGSYTESANDDEAVDELLCLYDMSWENPNSYLLDDELGELASKIPDGVRLTVVLDSCYSGTGTRALGPRRPKTQLIAVAETAFQMAGEDRAGAVRSLTSRSADSLKALRSEPEKIVVARFVEPNAKHQELLASRKLHKIGKSLQRAELNHQLLSAASDSQTAADAFIDGEYHGAFSFFLSKSASGGGRQSITRVIVDSVRRSLQNGGYGQTPQLEGPFAGEVLFGGTPSSPPPTSTSNHSTAHSPLKQAEVTPATNTPPLRVSTLDRFLTLADKFLDVADRLSRAEQEGAAHSLESAARTPSEVVVYVHGISQHRPGYSDPWWNAMRPYLTRPLTKTEVVWSDIVNPRSEQLRSALSRATPEHADLRRKIEAELSQRIETDQRSTGRTRVSREVSERAESEVRGDGLSLDDFLRYMLDVSVRKQILQRFDSIVRPLLDNGVKVHVISHSWGTVVAYEGLRNLDSVSLSGRVANLFVVGSALSIGAVQSNLFGRVTDGRRPSHVDRLINLDAGGDPVGGTIADQFDLDAEHIGLQPTGCTTIPFTNIAISISCAHSSYFRPENHTVNRDIFGVVINRQ